MGETLPPACRAGLQTRPYARPFPYPLKNTGAGQFRLTALRSAEEDDPGREHLMPVTIRELHRWDLTPKEAIALQRELAAQVIDDEPLPLDAIALVGGVDVSVKENVSRAAVVVLTYPELRVIESVTASTPTPFPYIPGLLSFREGRVILDAMNKLKATPDVFI